MTLLSPTLGFLVHDVARLLRRRFEQNARGSGLTRSQWQVLSYLAQNEGINQTGLAELLEIEAVTLGRIIEKLETQGLVERLPDPADRRAWILRLTPDARPVLTQVRNFGEKTRGEALAGLTDADIRHLMITLQKVKANLIGASEARAAIQKGTSHG